MKRRNWQFNKLDYILMILFLICQMFSVKIKAQEENDLSASLPKYLGIYILNIDVSTPTKIN